MIFIAVIQLILGIAGIYLLLKLFSIKTVKLQECEKCKKISFSKVDEICIHCDSEKKTEATLLKLNDDKRKKTLRSLLYFFLSLSLCALISIYMKK